MKYYLKLFCVLPLLMFLYGCYSFQGATTTVDSVKVNYFDNRAENVNPALSQSFTEALKEKIETESSLRIVEQNGMAELQGYISEYNLSTASVRAGESVALNRLTIKIKVDYVNKDNEKDNWTSTFSRFEDFAQDQSFQSVENELIEIIIGQLVDDIFRKAFVNW